MLIPASIETLRQTVEVKALLDTGAQGTFINFPFALRLRKPFKKLPKQIKVYNVDGTPNEKGVITHAIDLTINIGGTTFKDEFLITRLGKEDIILGYPWLKKCNATVDFKNNTVTFPEQKETQHTSISNLINDNPKNIQATIRNHEEEILWIKAKTAISHQLAKSKNKKSITDHKNLTYYRTGQKLNPRQARWSLFLSEFDLQLLHAPGTQMAQSDALSRRPDRGENIEEHQEMTMLPQRMFINAIHQNIKKAIENSAYNDEMVKEALEALKTGGPTPLKTKLTDWTIEEGMILFRGRCYLPKDAELRRKIVSRYHDNITMGHPGRFKTAELVKRDYWWPGMQQFINNYVDGCATCQQMKINTHPNNPPLLPIKAPPTNRPFSQITMDFITDLPNSKGYDSILVVVDQGLSKGVIFIPCHKNIDSLTTAELLFANVYRRFGLPDKIISDRGPQFASKTTKELGKLLGIGISLSTAYHPQTDGQSERVNQELEIYLRIYCANNPENWSTLLPTAEFAHNNRLHSAQNESPFFLLMGYNLKALPTVTHLTNIPAVKDRIDNLQKARDEALATHELARQMVEKRKTIAFKPFQIGERVWLESKNLKLRHESRKLAPLREGPFKIKEVLSPLNYRLEIPKQWRIHPVFHASLLSPFKQTLEHGPSFSNPPPDLIDGEEEFEVEAIMSHRKKGRGLQYLVTWKGYAPSDRTWEYESNLNNAKEILEAYKRRHKLLK